MNVIESVKAARRCGTPLIVIKTADPAASIEAIKAAYNGTAPPMLRWDVVRGAVPLNDQGSEALSAMLTDAQMKAEVTAVPIQMLKAARKLPEKTMVFFSNIHRFADEAPVMQALWNLRDEFKTSARTIVGLCPSIALPAELSQDVLLLDEPLPTDAQLREIATGIYNAAQIPQPAPEDLERIIDATLGLAAFPAEQSMAMCISKDGMKMRDLWQRKRAVIAQAPGLSVESSDLTFDDIRGCANAKAYLRRLIAGKEAPRCFVFLDEGEKMFAGSSTSGGDTSGISQDFLGTLLSEMQDNDYDGSIYVGFPGSAKSLMAKCVGPTAGVPTIRMDMGAMRNSKVGESQARLRNAMAVIKAVSQGRAFFIMACNGISSIPDELKRRFRAGIWMFDFPTAEERAAIWDLYLTKYADRLQGLDLTLPKDENWTGAEIANCVHGAYKLQCSLVESAGYIVPVYMSMGEDKVSRLRTEATGRYLSSSYPGVYNMNRATVAQSAGGRSIKFQEGE